MTKFFFIQIFAATIFCVVNAQTLLAAIPTGSYSELHKFSVSGQALPTRYVEKLPGLIHGRIMADMNSFVKSLNGTCREEIRVTFGARVTNESDPAVVDFEDGLVKIEASKCFSPSVNPKTLIAINSQMEFKKKAFSTLKKVTDQGDESCEWTDAPTVGKSHYCYLNQLVESSNNVQTLVSFLTFNDVRYDAPVYFRETLVSARHMGSATLFYSESYVRATKFSTFKRFFAKGFIQNAQTEFFQVLENSLHNQRN